MKNRHQPGWWRALFACFGVAVAASCSSPDYTFEKVDAGPDGSDAPDTGPPPPSTPTACAGDEQCAGLPATQVCDAATGYCAECDPEREAELGRCGAGMYCDRGRCAVGCQNDGDCDSLTCDPVRGLCINCANDANCAPGTACMDAVCTPACATSDTCPAGWSCCEGTCKNPQTDATACGGCGLACIDGACWNGVCGNPPCANGVAECDGDAENGCETEVASNPASCGRCNVACASGFCSGGMCTTMECADDTADCNENETDHCETDLTTTSDCGTCNNTCSSRNGTATCDDRTCAIACNDGFADCDEDADTGCEIGILEDPENCGECGASCSNENGSTECVDGECVPRCATGFRDCNGNANDGCETDINTTVSDCGDCGARCRPDNAAGVCDDGVCRGDCLEGFEDCNGNAADGCEADLTDPQTCGSCDNACSETGGVAGCDNGTCTLECAEGFDDCTGGMADGCETNIALSPLDCGSCGYICDDSMGTAVCMDGVCGLSTCTFPYEECIPGDGEQCDTDLRETDEYCGNCGTNCVTRFPHATGVCNGGMCARDACEEGYADCNGLEYDGCEVPLNTAANCRTCAETCEAVHGTNACTSNGCSPTCQSGWGDCDGNKNNGCETPLNTLFDCGACNVACNKGHGTETCASGSCQIGTCDTGWDDCNDESTPDGCETQLNTLTNCGGCGVPCDLAGGTESCGTGQCVLTGCNNGRADCTSQAGCETTLGTTSNCLGCGDACNPVNGTNACDSMAGCNPVCNTGYKSCDGDRGNGCETNIRSLTNCGDCGIGCDLPNATESCSSGTCAVTSCDTGWFDCSTSAAGCETQAGTVTNCSDCGAGCVNAHGTAQCNNGSCSYTCNAGWEQCDGDASNGCETSLTSHSDCGVCDYVCDLGGSGETCVTGTCEPTMCDANTADCDTNGSCETTLGTTSNCRSCGEACTALNGTNTCNTTNGCTPVCNTGYKSCDSNDNNGCERNIRTLSDCGDCDVVCDFPNSTETCTTGVCRIPTGGCNAGYADCDSNDTTACVPLGTATNCASCGNACSNGHGSNTCTGTVGNYDCSPTCDAGWMNCTNPDDGCETNIRTEANCGGCGTLCSYTHGGESCATGTCVMTGCDSGWGDCSPVGGDCETALNTTSACGACGVQCSNANGTTTCTSGVCVPTCSTGFKDCGNPNNGCETNITTVSNCGDCGVVCSLANATPKCNMGTCEVDTCNSDYGNCTASPGCETQLNTTGACGSCTTQCQAVNGTTACTGPVGSRVCTPTCNTGFANCDGDPNDGCEANLSSAMSCGACGVVCGGSTPNCVLTGSTYKCQAQITTAIETDGAMASNTLNLSHSIQSGTNRLVLVAVVAESQGNGLAGSRPDSVTYGGTAMTLVAEQAGVNVMGAATGTCTAGCSGGYCYDWWGPDHFVYVALESLIASKTSPAAIVINGATSPSPDRIIANMIQFNGVRQASPISAFNGGFLGTCATADPADDPDPAISPVVSIATSGSRIYSFMSALWMNGSPTFTTTPSTGFTFTDLFTSGTILDMRAFFRYVTTMSAATPVAGTYTPSFTIPDGCGRMTHLAVVVHPAQQ